jgi:hypothetical protein
MHHSTYKEVEIYRNTEQGYSLRWYSISPRLAADTLQGLKELIKEARQ